MSWSLVADIGGTNMRVAQVVDGNMVSRRDFPMTPDRDVAQTLADMAQELGGKPDAIIAAGAGTVINRAITLTNGGWLVCEDQIQAATGAGRVTVINDFDAAAWFLADVSAADIEPIGGSRPLSTGHRAAIGPGTGLGVGSLIQTQNGFHVVGGEGGHVTIGPRYAHEIPVFETMATLWPETQIGDTLYFEAEALLSGTGLPLLYQACGGAPNTKGREIFERARAGEAAARLSADIFTSNLAVVAGNLAVTLKALGGVFLMGGVAQSNRDLFDDAFWQVFRTGGRPQFTSLREECGIYLVTATDFGLRGCVNALRHLDT